MSRSLSLNNTEDIIADSIHLIKGNRVVNILELISDILGYPPETLNTLEK